jgi:uncharacterized phage-associated protein
MNPKYSAMTIAKWFAAWAEAEDADLSNLKLQKLLYYSQGRHLALHHAPLFGEPVEAWAHGPVVADVYHAYKSFRSDDVRLPESDSFHWEEVDTDTTQFLIRVWNTYGGLAAWRLRNMTHDESPWIDAFGRSSRNAVISHEAMEAFFASSTSDN